MLAATSARSSRQPSGTSTRLMLADAGMADDDIELSKLIQHWLTIFDSLVFKETLPVVFYAGSPRDEIAAYSHDKQHYVIVIPGLCRKMKRKQVVHFTRNRLISYPLSRANKEKTVSLQTAAMIAAIHEVRHNFQWTPGFEFLTYECPQLPYATRAIYDKLRRRGNITARDILALELSSWRNEEEKMGINEFDAKVIESVALNQAHMGCSDAEIAETIKMQPSAAAINI